METVSLTAKIQKEQSSVLGLLVLLLVVLLVIIIIV